MAQSKYRDNPPHQAREMNQSGMVTNAHSQPGWPNGEAFDKPEVEQYFTQMQERHWAEEDGPNALPLPVSPGDYELRARVEMSRYLHRPVTGPNNSKPVEDTDD